MEIGARIKLRREELEMSQEELAQKVGYKSRSSINKIEQDGRGLPQKKIKLFADALKTTPSYLMGWEPVFDEEIANAFHEDMKDSPKPLSHADTIFIDMVTSVLQEELKKEEFEALNKRIKERLPKNFGTPKPSTLAAHFDGDEFTESELEEIKRFAEFVKNNRK